MILIVGGGITGLLISRYLNDAQVIDKYGEPKNSLSSLWNVMPPLCGELKEECDSSANEFVKISEELNVSYSWKIILRTPPKGDKVLTPRETKEVEPLLDSESEIVGKALHVNGGDLLLKLSKNVKTANVTGIEVNDNQITSLKTNVGEMRADYYVFSIGRDEGGLFRGRIALDGLKGHVVVAPPLGMKNVLLIEDRLGVEGEGYSLLNGDSYPSNKWEIDRDQVDRTVTIFSKYLKKVINPIEIRVGFRAVSRGNVPILERIYDNAILVTGYKFGWSIAPWLAKRVKDMMRG
ncbi:MAG: FAD-dependent oxidoreductase [Metallosphaera sp.]|uniref:NAD(P)/FAD-dependent oxidoreductase n=1 Tax=Metallosphaera sp. TaxID=2020860 RepID=UPI00315FD070